ncbi:MAG: MBL fold metallo-hydrolase RNA specificity domain-containing protein, partial [Candidatus Micrarchaeota archaeon]
LVGGPSVRYFKELAPVAKNIVIIVGYQAEGTPGRLVKEGQKLVEVGGENVEVNCQVEVAPFSGHSDSLEILKLAKSVKGLKKIFVVHSEKENSLSLAKQMNKIAKTHIPELGETVQL